MSLNLGAKERAGTSAIDLPERWNSPELLLAAERTLLSWLRTGVALMGFGFVLERFDYVLRSINVGYAADDPSDVTRWVGIALVFGGAVVCALPALEFRRFVRAMGQDAAPRWYRVRLGSVVALTLAVFGATVAAYLAALTPAVS